MYLSPHLALTTNLNHCLTSVNRMSSKHIINSATYKSALEQVEKQIFAQS